MLSFVVSIVGSIVIVIVTINEPLVRVYPLRSSHCLGLPHPSRQTQTSLTVTPSGSRFGLNSLNLTLLFDLNFGQF